MTSNAHLPSLSLPLNESALVFAQAFAKELVRQELPTHEEAAEAISKAVDATCRFLIESASQGGTDGTLELYLNTPSVDFDLVVRNLGAPADIQHAHREGDDLLHWLESHNGLDRVFFKNCGKSGQQIHLVLYKEKENSTADQNIEEPSHSPGEHTGQNPYQGSIHVRRMQTGEALEVARCAFDAYGYSYVYETIYMPDRFEALNEANNIRSFVALDSEQHIAGHAALVLTEMHPGLADLAMVMTRKHYRGHNVATLLADACIKEAQQSKLSGVYIESVTSHVFTQKFSHKLGMKDCGFLLAHAPASLSFKGIDEGLHPRQSIVLGFLPIEDTNAEHTIYVPTSAEDFLKRLYDKLKLKRIIKKAPSPLPLSHAEINATLHSDLGIGTIHVERCGQGAIEQIASRVRGFIEHGVQVIECFVNLEDPATPALYEELIAHRFFLTGVLPNPTHADKLVMQRLEGILFDPDALSIANEQTADILREVVSHMPESF